MLPFWLTSTADRPPLRIGLLLDGLTVPAWTARVIDLLAGAPFLRIEILLLAGAVEPPAAARLHALYTRWDRGHLPRDRDPLAAVDAGPRLTGVQRIDVGRAAPLDVEPMRRVQAASLDVLLDLSGAPRCAGLAGVAKHGIWSYDVSPIDRETLDLAPLCRVSLVAQATDTSPRRELCTGLFARQSALSVAANSLQPLWGGTYFAVGRLRRLHESGFDELLRRPPSGRPVTDSNAAPSNLDIARWLAPAVVRTVTSRFNRTVEVPLWRLAIRAGNRTLLDGGRDGSLGGFQWIEAPTGRFYADPFVLEESGSTWLFVEDADLHSWRGAVSALKVGPDGRIGPPVRVLERPYHLSYPHLIREGGNLYMIPETRKHGTVELYRCEGFPDRWVFERELYRGPAVDTTVWIEDGRCWFFITFVDPRSGAGQLWLFSTTSLTGSWTSHPDNPISLDVRWNRGAGALFRDARGRLIRPSQSGRINYGRSFALNEVVTLDPSGYAERPLVVVEPPEDFLGVHSYARTAGLEVIDGLKRFPQRVVGGRPPSEAQG